MWNRGVERVWRMATLQTHQLWQSAGCDKGLLVPCGTCTGKGSVARELFPWHHLLFALRCGCPSCHHSSFQEGTVGGRMVYLGLEAAQEGTLLPCSLLPFDGISSCGEGLQGRPAALPSSWGLLGPELGERVFKQPAVFPE